MRYVSDAATDLQRSAIEQAADAATYALALLADYGTLTVVDGELLAGELVVNNHTELVDAVKEKFGFGCTLFLGNVRIATTAVAAGGTSRAIGTSTNEKITQQVLRSGLPFRGITRTIGKDWVIIYVPLRAHSGRIVGMLAAYRELADFVTELSNFDGVPEGVLLYEADGRVCDVNQAACDMLGYSKSELQKLTVADFTVGAPPKAAPLLESGDPTMVESTWRRADGHEFPVELSIEGIEDLPRTQSLMIARDFTERFNARDRLRALNGELRQLNMTLEEKVANRTRDLVVARDAALQASRAKSEFLANMSHELRTPLNAILGYSEILMEDSVQEGVQQFVPDLERIRSAGKHLLTIISDILDLAKIEAGQMSVYLEDIALGDLLRPVHDTVMPIAASNGNQLKTAHSLENALPLRTDVTKLRQILLNLLSNAVKFTKDGNVTLDVTVEDGDILFAVSDDGIGMDEQQLGRIYEAFEQADASTTRVYGGTGLGLTITRYLVGMLGGSIQCQSAPGAGAHFEVRLPRLANTIEASLGPTRVTEHQGDYILVIDDDVRVRDIVRSTLNRAGFDVVAVASGEEGLEQARQRPPIAITLDVMMPGMDGWTVLTTLKSNPKTREIPVIVMSIVDERKLGFTLGANEFLTKPVDFPHLVRTLRDFVRTPNPILVVDDDPNARDLVVRSVEAQGWDVVVASNGAVGLDMLERHRPSAIVLDLMMPTMNGFEFLELLWCHEELSKTPVIVLTAMDLTDEQRTLLTSKAEQVLQKGSASADKLLKHLCQILAHHGLSATDVAATEVVAETSMGRHENTED